MRLPFGSVGMQVCLTFDNTVYLKMTGHANFLRFLFSVSHAMDSYLNDIFDKYGGNHGHFIGANNQVHPFRA